MRVDYTFIRSYLSIITPYFLICTLPSWLGITNIVPEWKEFRFWFDNAVAVLFFAGIICLLWTMVHNAKLNMENK